MASAPEQIAQIEARLSLYLEAEASVLRNQSYRMPDGRELVRASLAEIRKAIGELRAELDLATGVRRVRGRARFGVIGG